MSGLVPHRKAETVGIDGHIDGDEDLTLWVLIVEDACVSVAFSSLLLFPWTDGEMEQGMHGWIIALTCPSYTHRLTEIKLNYMNKC